MAAATLPDWVYSNAFSTYSDLATKDFSKLIASGAMVESADLANFLAGEGDTYTARFALDLSGDSDVSDDSNTAATPAPLVGVGQKIARLIRNKSFAYKSVIKEKGGVPGDDPAKFTATSIGSYWGREADKLARQMITGVFADNAAAPTGTEHVQNDMTFDLTTANSSTYGAGITDFSIKSMELARATLGEWMDDIRLVLVHPTVYAKFTDAMLDSFTRRGVTIIQSGSLPFGSNLYHSWLLGPGALQYAIVDAKEEAYELSRNALTGKGGGETTIITRKNLAIAPLGTSYVGSTASGQPTNTTLAAAASWVRVYPERAQIPIARLITREA